VPKVSVTMITRNEADNIGRALESVAWADEVIVVDAESTDDTVSIAKRFTDRVVVRAWAGDVDQKNYAASLAGNDWILSVDADERVTPELAAEIRGTMAMPAAAAYKLPRVTWHLGRWIRATDWFPDYQVRLYDRRHARWVGRYVHEAMSVEGATHTMRGELQHFPYRSISDHLETIDRYTTYAARQMHERGERAGFLRIAAHPPLAFLRNYLAKGGIREGSAGLIVSAMNAYYVFLKFAKLRELQEQSPSAAPDADS